MLNLHAIIKPKMTHCQNNAFFFFFLPDKNQGNIICTEWSNKDSLDSFPSLGNLTIIFTFSLKLQYLATKKKTCHPFLKQKISVEGAMKQWPITRGVLACKIQKKFCFTSVQWTLHKAQLHLLIPSTVS